MTALLPCVWSLSTNAAHAQYSASARVERPITSTNDEDASAAGTEIDLQHRELGLETLSDVVREVPGTHPVVSGGYGSFSGLSLRGSHLGHTVWVLGEVPLNGPDTGAFDMSTMPLSLLGSMEVYRGGAPAWYSQGAIAGVVRVTPSESEGTEVSAALGAGSFGRYEGRATSEVVADGVSLRTGVQVSGSQNDYVYAYDGIDSDDRGGRRSFRNAQVLDGSGLVHLRIDAGPGELDLVLLGLERAGGVPGTGTNYNTRYTRRGYLGGLASLSYTQQGTAPDGRRLYRLQVQASARTTQDRFQDPLGEYGLPLGTDSTASWWRIGLRTAASYSPLHWLEATLVGSFDHDRFDTQNTARAAQPTSTRHSQALTGELRAMGKLGRSRAELRSSVRLQFSQAVSHYEEAGMEARRGERILSPTYRVATVVEAVRGLSVRASFATGQRLPSMLEMFGNGGLVSGNADELEPERGLSSDVGLVLSGNFAHISGTLEAGAFVQRVDDIIVWHSNAQNRVIALNEDRALIPGAEIGLHGSVGRHLDVLAAATFLKAHDVEQGTQLPRRPKAAVFVRPEFSLFTELRALSRLGVFGSVDYQGSFFLDYANRRLQPQRTFLGAGLVMAGFEERLAFTFRGDNLSDVITRDFLDYPLPGRAFSALVQFKQEM